MVSHRLALWCWLQQTDVLSGEYSLIHIDRHTDARRWEGPGEQEGLSQILAQFSTLQSFERYESFQCPHRDPWNGRETRPSITYDNFVHLAAEAKLFLHYYIYSSVGDWHTSLDASKFSYYKQTKAIYHLAESLENSNGKCIVDIDLDFFDDIHDFVKRGTSKGLLRYVMDMVAKHRDKISMITISLNDLPGDELWEERMSQMRIVKSVLGMDVPLPIME